MTRTIRPSPLVRNAFILRAVTKRAERFKKMMIANPFASAIGFVVLVWWIVGIVMYFVEQGAEGKNINSIQDGIWWGIVTLLTVGYGDKFPVTLLGRSFAVVLMVSGVIGIAIVTAKISSYFLERALREGRGLVDTEKLDNHFVICGWKDEMANFLIHLLDTNPKVTDSALVLVNAARDADNDALLEHARLRRIKIIRGNFFEEVNLRRAAPERAEKVLILADTAPDAQGKVPTPTEADARTIMTAMTLNNIAKGIPVVAEILDSAMDQYLKLAQVNEIIYSKDYARLLLAMASTGTGVTNIFHYLLDPHSPYFLRTREIPDSMFNSRYDALVEHFHQTKPNELILGVLENSGNAHLAKESALKRAQQTPNIGQLVSNLQTVKALKFNHPVFGPDVDYIVREGSMAIVIERPLAAFKAKEAVLG